MATSKVTKQTPKPSQPKHPKDPAPDTQSEDLSRAAIVLRELLARWPALTLDERSAFRALVSDAKADELGRKTKAVAVRDEAVRWVRTMDVALRAYPGALSAYSPKRFAWLLQCVEHLDTQISEEQGKRSKVGSVRGTSETAYSTALSARRRLVQRMRTFAGDRDAERAALSAALGETDSEEHLAVSIRALVKLGTEWQAREDALSKIQAEAAGLTKAELDAALSRATLLLSSSANAVLEGNNPGGDSPPVNRAEGRVLWEMREARRIFADAREENEVVPKLTAGPAVRAVIGSKRGGGGSDVADDEAGEGELVPAPAGGKPAGDEKQPG